MALQFFFHTQRCEWSVVTSIALCLRLCELSSVAECSDTPLSHLKCHFVSGKIGMRKDIPLSK